MLNSFSIYAIPIIIGLPIIVGIIQKKNIFKYFIEGVIEGLGIVLKIFPYILAIFVAVSIFKETGVMDILSYILSPIVRTLNIPIDIIPLCILRPVSGGACMPIVIDIFKRFGPDSVEGKLSSVIMSASETTLYTITIFFGSVGIKNIRGTLIAGLIADVTVVIVAIILLKIGII